MNRGAEILARWDGRALRAVGGRDRDALSDFPPDTVFLLRKWEPGTQWMRGFINKFAEIVAENHPDFLGPEAIKAAVKSEHRWLDGVQVEPDGSASARYKSVGKMDQDELARFNEQLKRFCGEIGLDVEVIEREAVKRMKPRGARS